MCVRRADSRAQATRWKNSSTKAAPAFSFPRISISRQAANLPTLAFCSRWGIPARERLIRVIRSAARGLRGLVIWFLRSTPWARGNALTIPMLQERTRGWIRWTKSTTFRGTVVAGWHIAPRQVWDAIRSLDYLASHPLVDPARLASTGQSGGATLTMLLACADPRLSAAVVSSGNTENFACKDFDPPGSTDDAEQDLIGSALVGFDRWDLFYPMAPKPLLVLVSEHDFFGTTLRVISAAGEEYQKLADVYQTLGKPDHLQWQDTPLPHWFDYSLRLDTYSWFERWLKQSDRKIENEPPVEPEIKHRLCGWDRPEACFATSTVCVHSTRSQKMRAPHGAVLAAVGGRRFPSSLHRAT